MKIWLAFIQPWESKAMFSPELKRDPSFDQYKARYVAEFPEFYSILFHLFLRSAPQLNMNVKLDVGIVESVRVPPAHFLHVLRFVPYAWRCFV